MANPCIGAPLGNAEKKLISDVQHGHYEQVLNAIDTLSANISDDDGCTLLHWAAINNRVKIAELLLNKGAKVNTPGGILQEIPLQWCCRSKGYGSTMMLSLLIQHGSTTIWFVRVGVLML